MPKTKTAADRVSIPPPEETMDVSPAALFDKEGSTIRDRYNVKFPGTTAKELVYEILHPTEQAYVTGAFHRLAIAVGLRGPLIRKKIHLDARCVYEQDKIAVDGVEKHYLIALVNPDAIK